MSHRPGGVRRARSHPGRGPAARRALLVLVVSLGWALVPVVAAGAAPGDALRTDAGSAVTAAGPDVTDGLPVQIAIEQVTPQALAPGQDLTVSLRVTNVGAAALTQPRVIVRLARSAFISRTSLDRWRDAPTTAGAGTSVLEVDVPGPLAPGASADVTGVVPAAAIGLRSTATSWGARGLAVEVVDAADPARLRLGLVRTFLVWLPPQEVVPTTVTVLVPVVGPAPDASAGAELTSLTATGGRLDRVLHATSGQEVTWALDPWLVGATTPAAEVGDGVTSGVDSGLARWRSALLSAAPDDVQLLPYGDADVSALAHAAAGALLDTAVERSTEVAAAAGLLSDTVLRWPGDTLPDLATASAVGRDGLALVVGPGALAPPAILTYTPTGRTTASTGAGDVPLLVADERLSTGLATGRVGPADATGTDATGTDATGATDDAGTDPQLTGAVAAADLLAELAVITRERPSDGRHLLLTVPRDWAPDPDVAAAQLAALSAVPWVATAPVSDLVDAEDPAVDRGSLPDREVDPAEVSTAEIATVVRTLEERADIASIAADPAPLVGDPEAELLAPTALAWRSDTAGRTAAITASVAATDALRSAVAVQRGSDVNLIATSGALPVRVTNTLDQDVVVQVRLRPGGPQLVADEAVTVTVPAGGEVTASVPVHAIQSADVEVAVELRTAAGTLIDDSAVFVVRVRADWEGIGTAVLGALLAVGVVVGLVRTIRRGRGRRGTPRADPGPDDLSPEQPLAEHDDARAAAHPAEESPT